MNKIRAILDGATKVLVDTFLDELERQTPSDEINAPTDIPDIEHVIGIVERFDVEAESRRHGIDFFAIDSRQDR